MSTTNPVCSHCETELDDEDTWHGQYSVGKVHSGDCEDSELKCPNMDCGKTFHVRCTHRIEFMKIDADGDEI